MKKIFSIVMIATMLFLTGCTSSTMYGECVGALADENPALHYNVSAWNVVMAVLFFETVFVPVVVVLSETKCPDGPAWKK